MDATDFITSHTRALHQHGPMTNHHPHYLFICLFISLEYIIIVINIWGGFHALVELVCIGTNEQRKNMKVVVRNGICYGRSTRLLFAEKCLHCVRRRCAWGKGPAHVCWRIWANQPIRTLVPCWMPKPLSPRNQCTGCFTSACLL